MIRYVAFLRGVSPLNLKMVDLSRCIERAGGTRIKTLLSSGNVAFDYAGSRGNLLENLIEKTLMEELERSFRTIIWKSDELRALVASEPFARFRLPAAAKPVVTFSRKLPGLKLKPPIKRDGAQLLFASRRYALSAYVPNADGPAFMKLIEQTFGKDVTTRTWETVKKCAAA